jgi:haloalkane dehalogenase
VHVQDSGQGPPILLLHGQPGQAGDWDAVVARLRDAHRVLVPDRPGYGRTGGDAVGVAENAAAMVAVLDRHGVDAATVVGHSWGGGVALALAQRHPERVRSLVLLSSIGTRSSIAAVDRLLAAPVVGDGLSFVIFRILSRLLVNPRVRSALGPDADVIPLPHLETAVAQFRTEPVWRSFVVEQRAFLRETGELEAGLSRITTPTVVVSGDRDAMVPPASSVELAATIPYARLVRIPGAGHFLPFEVPDDIAALIAEVAVA